MTPRQYLDGFRADRRLLTGGYYEQEPVPVSAGDTVGVVLMHAGGPKGGGDVERFLYDLFMDPAAMEAPLRPWLRHPLARLAARLRARQVGRNYHQIGGCSQLDRHTREQARGVEKRLNERFGATTGATFRTYVATRYGCPSSQHAGEKMKADGVNRVVLLPLYPQYSRATSGAGVAYWKAIEAAGDIEARPTSLVYEYAAHPKYVQALSERIDEALQRFPRDVRERAHLVFSAHGMSQAELARRRDPYCCLVHSTVFAVMKHRAEHDPDRQFHVAFQRRVGPARWLAPSTPEKLDEIADAGAGAVVVIPVASVSDHIETAFELDIRVRESALHAGIEHFEVTAGLNCHPLFIEALAECVAAQVSVGAGGDGMADPLPDAIPTLPRFEPHERTVRCPVCTMVSEAHDWSGQAAVQRPLPERVAADKHCAPDEAPAPARAA